MKDEPIFQNSGIKIIMIDKKEYYLLYKHYNIPKLTTEIFEKLKNHKEKDINLGTITLYDKIKDKSGRYIKITPKYVKNDYENLKETLDINKDYNPDEKNEEGILMTKSIKMDLLESDYSLLGKVVNILEGKNSLNLLDNSSNNNNNNINFNFDFSGKNQKIRGGQTNTKNDKNYKDVLKIDFNEKKLKIISIVNKGINLVLFSIDIEIEYISDLSELLEITMGNFRMKFNGIKEIDKCFDDNNKKIDELNLKKTRMLRQNQEKMDKLNKFVLNELNKKKKINLDLYENIHNVCSTEDEKKEKILDVVNEQNAIKEENENIQNDSQISLGSFELDDKKLENDDLESNLSLSDL